MLKSPLELGHTMTEQKIDWEVMFWKLATLISMGWYDEARRLIATVLTSPWVVRNDSPQKD